MYKLRDAPKINSEYGILKLIKIFDELTIVDRVGSKKNFSSNNSGILSLKAIGLGISGKV